MTTTRVSFPSAVARITVAIAAVALPFAMLSAQPGSGAAPTRAASASTRERKVLNIEDYGRWNRINAAAISSDGKWTTFTYTPNEGEPTLHVKALDGDKVYSTSLGTAPGGGGRAGGGGGRGGGAGNAPQFSSDSRWITYFVNPPDRTAGRGGRGAAPVPAGRGAAPAAATPGHLEVLNLASGEKTSITNASSWKFSANARWLATRLNKAQADAKHSGADLIVRDLGDRRQSPHRQREPVRVRRVRVDAGVHGRCRRTTGERGVPARSGHRRDAPAGCHVRRLRPAHLEHRRRSVGRAARRQGQGHEAEGQRAAHLERTRRGDHRQAYRARSCQDRVVPRRAWC